MVYIQFDPATGLLVKSFAADPGNPQGLAIRALDVDFATWTDDQWDAGAQDVKAGKGPPPKGEPLLEQIARDVAVIRAWTDKHP